MIFGGFLDTDLTNQCYIIDHNTQSISKMKRKQSEPNSNGLRIQGSKAINNNAASGRNDGLNDEQSFGRSNNASVAVSASSSIQQRDQAVLMKKNKKFIKFKDFIIKLPNSTGIISNKNELLNYVDISPHMKEDHANKLSPEDQTLAAELLNPLQSSKHLHPNQQYKDKGYSIYVVDDEHEIHKFDIDTYEWSIITTTKDED